MCKCIYICWKGKNILKFCLNVEKCDGRQSKLVENFPDFDGLHLRGYDELNGLAVKGEIIFVSQH
jgi:hypothetical protein